MNCWELEWFIEQYSLIHRSAIRLEMVFWKYFEIKAKFLKWSSRITQLFDFHTKVILAFCSSLIKIKPLWSSRCDKNMAYLHFLYYKVKERIHGETNHAISIKRCKCMSRWMDGWIWLTPNGFSLSNHPYLYLSLSFWDKVTPLFFFSL